MTPPSLARSERAGPLHRQQHRLLRALAADQLAAHATVVPCETAVRSSSSSAKERHHERPSGRHRRGLRAPLDDVEGPVAPPEAPPTGVRRVSRRQS